MSGREGKTLAITLSHGRKDPNEDMEDWGFNGPVLPGVDSLHIVYLTQITVAFANADLARYARDKTGWDWWDETIHCLQIRTHKDMIQTHEGYFGDWTIALSDPTTEGTKTMTEFPFEEIRAPDGNYFASWAEAKAAGYDDDQIWSVTGGDDEFETLPDGTEMRVCTFLYGPPHHYVNHIGHIATSERHDGATYFEERLEMDD